MTMNIKHGVFDAGSLVNVILLFFDTNYLLTFIIQCHHSFDE